jgi:putative transposase
MRHCKENGLEKTIWRYLPFSLRQWKAWSGQKHCINSLQGYCRKQNPQQLSLSEQEIIKTGCANKDYENWPLNSILLSAFKRSKNPL